VNERPKVLRASFANQLLGALDVANLQALREKREQLNAELNKISNSIKEKRAAGKVGAELWTPEENTQFQKLSADITTLDADIAAEERSEQLEQHLAKAAEARGKQTRFGRTDPKLDDDIPSNHAGMKYGEVFSDRDEARSFARMEEKRCMALYAWMCESRASERITDVHRQAVHDLKASTNKRLVFNGLENRSVAGLRSILAGHNTAESRAAAYGHLQTERRAIGYSDNYSDWVPVQFRDAFEVAFHGMGGVMDLCDLMITDSADQLPWPFADDYGNEGHQVDEDTPENLDGLDALMSVPKLGAYNFSSKFAKVAKALLSNSPFDLATMLGEILGSRLARVMERKLTLGDRNETMGGYLSRGVSATTVPKAAVASLDKLQTLIWSVINEHRMNGTIVMHDQTLRAFAALVDGTNVPLLGVANGRLQVGKDISYPYRVSNYLPYADSGSPLEIAVGEKPFAFGNFKQMKVRVVRAIRLERMDELFAEDDQAGFIAHRSADADLLRSTNTENCPIKFVTGA
jgi:HK97 family phage major capsid protein